MSIAGVTTPRVTRRRATGLVAVAIVAALAMALIWSNRAGAQASPTSISASPTSASQLLGATHTVLTSVFPSQAGVRVRAEVLSGPNEGQTLTGLTNTVGNLSLSYVGDGGTGTDALLIWVDVDLDGVRDAVEPQTAAVVSWRTAPITGISLAPDTATQTLGTVRRMTATISPAQSGVIVRFRVVSGPNLGDPRIATSDANGAADFRYTGAGGVGVDTILAWADLNRNGIADAGEPRDTATTTWVTASTGGLTLTPGADSNPVGSVHELTASLSPAQSGLLVRFSVVSGPNAGERTVALSDVNGRATFSYFGDGGAGTDVIIAWVDDDGDGVRDASERAVTATKEWVAVGPTSIFASPQSDTNPIGTVHTVRATVSPARSGEVVRFRVSTGPHAGANGRSLTNNAGQTTYSYQGTRTGTDSIAVWVDLDDDGVLDAGEPRAFSTKVWTGAPVPSPTKTIALVPISNVSLLGSTHSVTATVGPAQSGTIVRFFVSMGPNRGDSGVAVTNTQGRATFSYVGNGGTGTDAIVAWVDQNNNGVREAGEPQTSAIQRWVTAQATSISASPANSSGPVNTQHTVTAQVSPATNGVLVRFRVTQGPNLGDQGSDLTNSNGRASFTYVGNGGIGSDLVLVWADLDGDNVVDPAEPQAAAIRNWTQVAGSGFSLSPANDTNPVNTRHSMTATVSPAQRDLKVRFEVLSGPNEGTRGSDETNSNGRADLSYVGDEGIGTDVIRAWIDLDRDGRLDTGEPQAIATKQWVAPAASALTLSPSVDTEQVGRTHRVTAQLSPQQRGVLIRFEVISGPNEGVRDRERTNSDGRASDSYRGRGGLGTDVILAWVDLDEDGRLDTGEPQATAVVTWVGEQSDAERAREICDNLDHYSHPSLPTLCGLIESGNLSDHSERVIIGVIIKNAEKSTGHSNRDRDDDDHDDDEDDDDDDDDD